MDPRIVFYAMTGIAFDMLCFAATAGLLLANNPWLQSVGGVAFFGIVGVVGVCVTPILYNFERNCVEACQAATPERVDSHLPAWAGTERSERLA